MTDNGMWPYLWATELDKAKLPTGSVVAFAKASVQAGEYGLTDSLIAGLDRLPLTHAGIVQNADGDEPWIVHSTLAGIRLDRLSHAAREHRHSPAFVFTHADVGESTLQAVVDLAASAASPTAPARPYPFHDLLAAAVLLRLRLHSGFDEHAHRELAALFAALTSDEGGGRMCAAFLAQCFADSGVPLAPPDERTAFEGGIATNFGTGTLLPMETVPALAAGIEALGAAMAERCSSDTEAEAELLHLCTKISSDGETSRDLAEWLITPPSPGELVPATVRLLRDCAVATTPQTPVPSTLASRFTTVNDMLRSPNIQPAGHIIDWADDPAPPTNRERTQ